MGLLARALLGIAVLVIIGVAALLVSHARVSRALGEVERRLATSLPDTAFDEGMVSGLPEPARRHLLHAIRPGVRLARSVELVQTGRMRPRSGARSIELTATETLAAGRGFVWRARARMAGFPVDVADHYLDGEGAVQVNLFGLIPIETDAGRDVARSSRGRFAGECIWLPSALLPVFGASWEAVDGVHARAGLEIDGETVTLTLAVEQDGRLREITLERHGNVGQASWGPTPYGFAVLAESTFGAYTIPSVVQGGWWYGTPRYDPEGASEFRIVDARFR
jgi:hypothetical protein